MHPGTPSCFTQAAIEAELAELEAIRAESMGWLPLTGAEGEQGYLHLGEPPAVGADGTERELVLTVVGIPDVGMAGMNVLLVNHGPV